MSGILAIGFSFGFFFDAKLIQNVYNISASKAVIETQLVSVSEFDDKNNNHDSHEFDNTIALFHVGKAGGGTVWEGLKKNRIKPKTFCHVGGPTKCLDKLQYGPATTLIINVRDPLDRFVSAFRWRWGLLCKPGDKREPNYPKSWQNPLDYCQKIPQKEALILTKKYQSNPNLLAEALCENSPTRETAMKDYSSIKHSTTLSHWLHFLTNATMIDEIKDDGIQNFYVVPLEKQHGNVDSLLKQHVQRLSFHLLKARYGEEVAIGLINENHHSSVSEEERIKHEHSSARFHNLTNSTVPSVLSRLGECCLVRHLEEDYRLIQAMIGGEMNKSEFVMEPLVGAHPLILDACLYGNKEQQSLCQSDLKSMLLRRAQYLDRSTGSCFLTTWRDRE